MANEFYAFLILFLSLSGVLISFKLGANYLKTFVVVCYIIANIFTVKIGNFFGIDTTPGIFLFSAIYLSTDLLAERYGKKVALEAVYYSFFAIFAFTIISQANLLFAATPYAQSSAEALDLVFSASPRIFIASVTAYVIWQWIDIYIYEKIHRKTGESFLWVRNNVSTLISSLGSTFTFFALAFYGTGANWVEMFIAGVVVYWIVALLDTVIIYLSKYIKPLDILPQ